MSISKVREFIDGQSITGRPYYFALERLLEDASSLQDLISASRLPRRSIEHLISLLGDDTTLVRERYRIKTDRRDEYCRLLDRASLQTPITSERISDAVAYMTEAIAHVPATEKGLDHVQATPSSVIQRAEWILSRYLPAAASITFVGDHDLTSLGLAFLHPGAMVQVLDINEALLEYLEERLTQLRATFELRHCDLRFELPPDQVGKANLFVTDPPYTPEGAALFVSRGLSCLNDLNSGRGLMAYGYGREHPTLALKVQKSILSLQCIFEDIRSDFDQYSAAQAIGSSSDWYTIRATPGTGQQINQTKSGPYIYTHGRSAREAAPPKIDKTTACFISQQLSVTADKVTFIGPADSGSEFRSSIGLAAALISRARTTIHTPAAVIDLRQDTGPALFRALLNLNIDALAAIVDRRHPDVSSTASRALLQGDIGSKYAINVVNLPSNDRLTMVTAQLANRPADEGCRYVLNRASGKLKNIAREAYVIAG
ncbi:MAG: bis-aminopropyl spermidine synthase family protein, partial [Mycobacterium sp.]|nr:bis-aminopropyl spermidine synthase family protein [Mycobacterium sp.]